MTTAYTPIDIILADDHEIFRDGFTFMLQKTPEINLVGEATNGEELLQLARSLKPDVVVTDIKMPIMDGVEATRLIKKEFLEMGVIALSMFDEDGLIVDMLEAGARGYLLKNARKQRLLPLLNQSIKMSPTIVGKPPTN